MNAKAFIILVFLCLGISAKAQVFVSDGAYAIKEQQIVPVRVTVGFYESTVRLTVGDDIQYFDKLDTAEEENSEYHVLHVYVKFRNTNEPFIIDIVYFKKDNAVRVIMQRLNIATLNCRII